MSVHTVTLKGKRAQNEDKHNVIINIDGKDGSIAPINFYAVYDGHGGKFVSKFLSENIPQFFTNLKITYPLHTNYVERVYGIFDNILSEKYSKYATEVGSTCLIVIQYKHGNDMFLNILNTGDSRCILCRNNMEFALTKDHKPNWPEEKIRLASLGGEITFDGFDWRIGDLSVSRAFGDLGNKPFITNMPDIYRYKIQHTDKFVVLACDGLWDIMTNQDVVNYVLDTCYDISTNMRINKKINVAKRLAEYAIAKGSTDNVSVIVFFLD